MRIRHNLTLLGPNWRSDRTVIELHFELHEGDREALTRLREGLAGRLTAVLETIGVHIPAERLESAPEDGFECFVTLFAMTAVQLQRAAGHEVDWVCVIPRKDISRCIALFEYEQMEVGQGAQALARRLLSDLAPELSFAMPADDEPHSLKAHWAEFKAFAATMLLPGDTRALIAAAQRRDVPAIKLERWPYRPGKGEFRVRANGLLRLGQCRYQQVVDGTFCPERSAELWPLLADRERAWQVLHSLGVPLPRHDAEFRNLGKRRRIERVAGRIGYPVIIKPRNRLKGRGHTQRVNTPDEMAGAISAVQRAGKDVLVEGFAEGRVYRLILAAGDLLLVYDKHQGADAGDLCHESLKSEARRIAAAIPGGLLMLTVVTPDIAIPLEEAGGVFVDLDPAPELDTFLPVDGIEMTAVMDALLGWLYPPGSRSRIPILTVTGTNGKTTTSRMAAAILQAAGYGTALTCTDGAYFNGKSVDEALQNKGDVQFSLLGWEQVEAAVYETHFGRLFRGGLAYRWNDVGVCTNVTHDHIGRMGIETVDQMARLKRSVVERARHCAVLNADDERCLAMIASLSARRICLTSTVSGHAALQELIPRNGFLCLVEQHAGEDWIVIHDRDSTIPVVAVDAIPATFGGMADFNVSNAVQAVAACHGLAVPAETMRSALTAFGMSFERTPGRLNLHDNGRFRVMMDYAHNIDGFQRLCDFLRQLDIQGKLILLLAIAGDRTDDSIRNAVSPVEGFFDHYACRRYPDARGRQDHEVPSLLREGLMSAGVPDSAISRHYDPIAAITEVLQMAGPGDLVVMTPATHEISDMWERITSFDP